MALLCRYHASTPLFPDSLSPRNSITPLLAMAFTLYLSSKKFISPTLTGPWLEHNVLDTDVPFCYSPPARKIPYYLASTTKP